MSVGLTVRKTVVSGVDLYHLPVINELRGTLSYAQHDGTLPFVAKRYFLIYDVSSGEVRGEHAHKTQHQFMVCVTGTLSIVFDDGRNREEIMLNGPQLGVHMSPMVWAKQQKYSPDAVLLVLASDIYKEDDYIRDYDAYLQYQLGSNG